MPLKTNCAARRAKPLRLVIAALLTISAAGCNQTSQSGRVPIPPLDSEARAPCPDPGIDRNAKIAVIQHRRALAVCEGRRALAVDSYEAVRDGFGVKGEAE